jgi:hypothetical protein
MGYRWKPNKTQRLAYAAAMDTANEQFNFIQPNGAIRNGCAISWVDKSTATEFSGVVVNNSYGELTGQHTFTVLLDDGSTKKKIMGRNLYDRLTAHVQGSDSIEQSTLF